MDSLTYDGWERLTDWKQRYKKSGQADQVTTETYSFDSTSNRLLSRVEPIRDH